MTILDNLLVGASVTVEGSIVETNGGTKTKNNAYYHTFVIEVTPEVSNNRRIYTSCFDSKKVGFPDVGTTVRITGTVHEYNQNRSVKFEKHNLEILGSLPVKEKKISEVERQIAKTDLTKMYNSTGSTAPTAPQTALQHMKEGKAIWEQLDIMIQLLKDLRLHVKAIRKTPLEVGSEDDYGEFPE